MADLSSRLKNRVQWSSDGLREYVDSVERAFGSEVDHAQVVKTYSVSNLNKDAASRYSPAEIVKTKRGWNHLFARLGNGSHVPGGEAESYPTDALPLADPTHECLQQEVGQLQGGGVPQFCVSQFLQASHHCANDLSPSRWR